MSRAAREALRLLLGAAGLVGAIVWLSGGCGDRIGPGEAQLSGEDGGGGSVARVQPVAGPAVERATGTVASARQTTVSSKILARIESVRVSAGSVVREGDVLVTLDDRELEARRQEAAENLRAARAQLDLARAELARVENLVAADVGTQKQLDQARSAERVAAAAVEAATQALAEAEVARSHTEIRSPVAGRVVDRLAEPGDTAAPGAPLLQIYDPGVLRLEVPVRERIAITLSPGQALPVEIDALGERLEGTVDEIVPFAEPGARTLLVKVRLPPHPQLFAGMFGRIEIPTEAEPRLMVPLEAVSRVGQLEFARVRLGDGSVERRVVTTGRRDEQGRVELLSGVAAGETVLLGGSP